MVRSYAKINLSIDVGERQPDGFHPVDMIMQQIQFHDDVTVVYQPSSRRERGDITVSLQSNRVYLPSDERNLAVKAAILMIREYGKDQPGGRIDIRLLKRIPVAAGMAGGSGNGAAVLHGLNILWDLGLSLQQLCDAGAKLGSDVPFCVMGQAAENEALKDRFAGDPLACHCALATGTGTDLVPIKGLKSHIVLSKPPISVSTAKAYQGIDNIEIKERPNTEELIEGLKTRDVSLIEKNMVNVLENYTLMEYPTVVYTKNKMQELCNHGKVLMSGSGPTVFGICADRKEAQPLCRLLHDRRRMVGTGQESNGDGYSERNLSPQSCLEDPSQAGPG